MKLDSFGVIVIRKATGSNCFLTDNRLLEFFCGC